MTAENERKLEAPIAHSASKGYAWLALYFLCNLTLTLYNKAVMHFVGFKFPWLLTAVHTLCWQVTLF
jgi:hypothetical protein